MTCKDCLKYDVCGKAHRLEHPDESGAEYTCKNFYDISGIKTVTLKKYYNSKDTGYCSKCNSCCGIDDNFCSYCGGKIVRDENDTRD